MVIAASGLTKNEKESEYVVMLNGRALRDSKVQSAMKL